MGVQQCVYASPTVPGCTSGCTTVVYVRGVPQGVPQGGREGGMLRMGLFPTRFTAGGLFLLPGYSRFTVG